jgi:hypothetical protein
VYALRFHATWLRPLFGSGKCVSAGECGRQAGKDSPGIKSKEIGRKGIIPGVASDENKSLNARAHTFFSYFYFLSFSFTFILCVDRSFVYYFASFLVLPTEHLKEKKEKNKNIQVKSVRKKSEIQDKKIKLNGSSTSNGFGTKYPQHHAEQLPTETRRPSHQQAADCARARHGHRFHEKCQAEEIRQLLCDALQHQPPAVSVGAAPQRPRT